MAQKYYVGSVTVRKREGKVGWYAYYRDGSGTQRLRSLKEDRTRLLRVCQDWGEIPISTINSGHIESWLAKNKRKSKWSSATRNRYLSAIKQVFKKAHGLNYLAENSALPLKATKEDENIPEPLTNDIVFAGGVPVWEMTFQDVRAQVRFGS